MKKSYKIDVDCANCANKMEVAANNTEGVKNAIVNFMMLKMNVEFEDGVILKNRNYNSFRQKSLKHPYDKNTYGVGYIGEEYYGRTKEDIRCYKTWQSMLERCYSEKHLKKRPTYKDCYVCDEWLCYSNFKKWYDNNYYEIKDERMCLDKDILIKGNKVYSPNTCVFVPNKINMLVLQNKNVRN